VAYYALSIAVSPSGSGYTVPAEGIYAHEEGSIVSAVAYPNTGYEFDYWEISSTSGLTPSYPAPNYDFSIHGNVTLVAHFIVAGTRPKLGFRGGVAKTAVVTFSNPTERAFSYEAKLFLDITETVSSSRIFNLAAKESKQISFPIVTPQDFGIYPVFISVKSDENLLKLYRSDNDMNVIGPSDLLYQYRQTLIEAIYWVNLGDPNGWIVIPGYGLQYASSAINQVKQLMAIEAVSIGLIGSTAECSFAGDVMYFTDGTTIIPYWWQCPYCDGQFRSPALREVHYAVSHPELYLMAGRITGCSTINYQQYCWDEGCYTTADGYSVHVTNISSINMTYRVELITTNWDNIPSSRGYKEIALAPGGSGTVSWPIDIWFEYDPVYLSKARLISLLPLSGSLLHEYP